MKRLTKYIISIFSMSYLLYSYGADIHVLIQNVNLIYLPIVVILSIFQYMLSAWRWYFIASNTNFKIAYSDAIKFYYISGFLNNILPTGILGDIYRTINIKVNDEKGNFLKSLQSVIFERLSGQVSLVVTFIMSLALLFLLNKKYEALLYTLALIMIILSLIKLVFRYYNKNNYINNFKFFFSGKLFYKHFFLSLIIVVTYITTYIICALALDLDIDIVSFFVFAPLVLFSMTLPVSIGGWGVRETAALAVSFLLGLSVSASVTVAIVYGLTNLLCSTPGMYFLVNKNPS